MVLRFDHPVLLTNDLPSVVSSFQRLGFDVIERHDVEPGEFDNRIVPFSDGSYIEISSFRETGKSTGHRFRNLEVFGTIWADYSLFTDKLDVIQSRHDISKMATSGCRSIEKTLIDGRRFKVDILFAGRGYGQIGLPFYLSGVGRDTARIPLPRKQAGLTHRVAGVSLATTNMKALLSSLACSLGIPHAAEDGDENVFVFKFNNCWIKVFEASVTQLSRDYVERLGGAAILEIVLGTEADPEGVRAKPVEPGLPGMVRLSL